MCIPILPGSPGTSILVKSQFATNAQKYPPPESAHMWTHPIMDSCNLSKVWAWFWMVWQAFKMCWWSVSSYSTGAEYIRCFKCPHRTKSKGLRSALRWAIPQKFRAYWHMLVWTCFLVLVWGNHFCSLLSHFR